MTIHYQLKPEDMAWRFGDPANRESASKMLRTIFLSLSVISLIITVVAAILVRNWSFSVTITIIGLAVGIIMTQIMRGLRNINEQMTLAYKSPEYAYLFGDMALEIDEEGVTRVSRSITTLWKWEVISEIVANDRYTFLASGSGDTIIIPHSGIQAGNYSDFIAETKRLHQLSRGQ